jgi:hypothetical protein
MVRIMGIGETSIDNAIEQVLDAWNLKHWRNQVFKGRVKNGWLETGIPGLPDRSAILPDGKTLYIEVKQPGESLRKDQEDFRDYCLERNVPWLLAESAEDVNNYLRNYFNR